MATLNDLYISHNVKNADEATPQIIFTAPRRLRIKGVKYRYRKASVGGTFLLLAVPNGEPVSFFLSSYLDVSGPLYDGAYPIPKGVGVLNQSTGLISYYVPFPDYAYSLTVKGVAIYPADWWTNPDAVIKYSTYVPQGTALGLIFDGDLTGLEDLDITVTLG